MGYNGYKKYTLLKEYNGQTNTPTGRVKPNIPSDPDYVPPVYDPISCPPMTTTTTTIANEDITVTIGSGISVVIHAVKTGWVDYSTNTSGTWTIPNYVYDYVLFDISSLTGTVTLTVTTAGGIVKAVGGVDTAWKVMVPGTFYNIVAITIE